MKCDWLIVKTTKSILPCSTLTLYPTPPYPALPSYSALPYCPTLPSLPTPSSTYLRKCSYGYPLCVGFRDLELFVIFVFKNFKSRWHLTLPSPRYSDKQIHKSYITQISTMFESFRFHGILRNRLWLHEELTRSTFVCFYKDVSSDICGQFPNFVILYIASKGFSFFAKRILYLIIEIFLFSTKLRSSWCP